MEKGEIIKGILDLNGKAAYNRDEPSSGDFERISNENSRLGNELQKATERIRELEGLIKAPTIIKMDSESERLLAESAVTELCKQQMKDIFFLKRDICKLKEELLRSDYFKKELSDHNFQLRQERDQLKADLAEAVKVIEFYGNRDNWVGPENKYQIIATHDCDTHGGNLARAFLAKGKK